jgi:hypothetical protein
MPSSYTPKLRLTLPVTGELSGLWGDTVNTGVTTLLENAIAGIAAVSMTDANYTLTTANGSADEARYMFLAISGTLTAARNVVCPTSSKLYYVSNSTTGGFAITLKTTAGTGIAVPNGKTMVLLCDGVNVVDATNYVTALAAGSLTLGTALAVGSGGTGATTASAARANLGVSAAGADITNQGYTKITLSNALSTIDWNLNNGSVAELLLNGNKTFNLPTNPVVSAYTLLLTNGATPYSVTWNAGIVWPFGTPPDTTVANSYTVISLLWNGTVFRGSYTPYAA